MCPVKCGMVSGAGSVYKDGRKLLRHTVLALTVSLALAVTYGCKEGPPSKDWSEQSTSPDGTWVALASNQRGGGMGAAFNDVTVSLKRTSGPYADITILSFSNQAQVADLKMDWLSPTHLNVTYPSYAALDFQAVKCAGIDISVVEAEREWPVPARSAAAPQHTR